ncbi:proteasome assembly chaperone 4-like [Saccostrea echinata]|uniref:proteasome assembly chaperone 4-like n=1 Tax=Saccostrea echinata TaxID=191078 RepID=UPI002A81CA4D|nr:proteasome assembly chaperone 4-like [Saccostrea echinata]
MTDLENVIDPQLKYHVFSDKIMEKVVHFQVLKLKESFYIWICTSNKLGNLAVAMQTKFSSIPSGAVLLGPADSHCFTIAQRLAKKTGKQVFVSGSVDYDQLMLPLIEKRIGQELQNFPEKFYDPN